MASDSPGRRPGDGHRRWETGGPLWVAPRGRPPTCDCSHEAGSQPSLDAAHASRHTHPTREEADVWRTASRRHRPRQAWAATSAHLLRLAGAAVSETQAPWSSRSEGGSQPWPLHVQLSLQFLKLSMLARAESRCHFFAIRSTKPRSPHIPAAPACGPAARERGPDPTERNARGSTERRACLSFSPAAWLSEFTEGSASKNVQK